MDEKLPQQPAPIVVPYKIGATPANGSKVVDSEDIERTKFQNIGDQYGTYGDSYGSLNTLFSGLAFAILIISLFMQRQELQAQRQELEAQRNEIKESNLIADKQRQITEQQATLNAQQIHDAKVQNFYNLLFRFLDEKRRKIDSLQLRLQNNIRGDDIFNRFVEGALNRLEISYSTKGSLKESPYEELEVLFEDFVEEGHNFSDEKLIDNQYFEYLCFILHFIEEHAYLGIIDNAIKIFISYQDINEMSSMFFISLVNDDLKTFIQKYALLRKMNAYEADERFLALVDKTVGEEAYTP